MRLEVSSFKIKVPKNYLGYECSVGRLFELIALKLIKGAIDSNSKSFKGKYDIEWNGLKIDVKMRNFVEKKGWSFVTRIPQADYYLLFCVDKGIIKKILFVPLSVFKKQYCVYQDEAVIRQPSKKQLYNVEIKNGYINDDLLEIISGKRVLPDEGTKICNKCHVRKPFADFYMTNLGKPRNLCKECYRAVERSKNPGRLEYWRKRYARKKKEEIAARIAIGG